MSETAHKTHEPTGESNIAGVGNAAGGLLSMIGRTTEGPVCSAIRLQDQAKESLAFQRQYSLPDAH